MKHKRVWTEEQKEAARQRMAYARAQKNQMVEGAVAVVEQVRPPEVQAVIDTMDPARKAKMEMMKARRMAELQQTKEGQEALQRLEEARHPTETVVTSSDGVMVPPMQRPGSYELRLIIRNDGTMVSSFCPCICGAGKRQWHKWCLKEANRNV